MSNRYGLIGFPLSHSFSKSFFEKKFKSESIDALYDLFPLESIEQFSNLIANKSELKGLNVTIPFKQAIIPFLNELSDEAANIGAVNTITVKRHNSSIFLKGYNTDAPAFKSELLDFTNNSIPKQALILGTGGAAAAVSFVLQQLECNYKFVSRNPDTSSQISYNQLNKEIINNTPLLINCTPLGMYPNVNSSPLIPYEFIGSGHYLYDLIYNPEDTQFLLNGRMHGAKTRNGMRMLIKQALLAWEIWNSNNE